MPLFVTRITSSDELYDFRKKMNSKIATFKTDKSNELDNFIVRKLKKIGYVKRCMPANANDTWPKN